MTTKTVFIIVGVVRYEGSDPVKSTTTRRKAAQFLKDIDNYNKKKPDDEEEESKEFKEWKKNHPAGPYGHIYDHYEIAEVELI